MLQNRVKENKLLIIVTGVLFLCLVLGWILYTLFGHQLIEAMYEGRSIGFLNRIIKGQATNPVGFYFDKADRLFFALLLGIPTAVIVFMCLKRIFTIRIRILH